MLGQVLVQGEPARPITRWRTPVTQTPRRFETQAVHAGYSPDSTTKSVAVPLHQTVAYAFDSAQHGADLFDLKVPGNIYTRIMNPTQDVLEQRIAALALASGQAAVTYSVLTITEAGDNIVASSALCGGTYNLFAHTLPQYGITTRFADHRDPASFEPLIDSRTKAIFVKSLGNPQGNVTDTARIAEIAHRHGVPVIVDNTVATPYLSRPIEHGADIMVHSLTKYLEVALLAAAPILLDEQLVKPGTDLTKAVQGLVDTQFARSVLRGSKPA